MYQASTAVRVSQKAPRGQAEGGDEAVAGDVRVGPEERVAVYRQEMDVGIPTRTEHFLQVTAQTSVSGQEH